MPRKQKKYHYIYKTTNVLNNKFYIGMHSTNNLTDGYMGSGKLLWYSIKKYGKENHKVEILEYLDNRDKLRIREEKMISEVLSDPLCINLVWGGRGGWEHVDKETMRTNALKGLETGRKTQKWLRENNTIWKANWQKTLSVSGKLAYEEGRSIKSTYLKTAEKWCYVHSNTEKRNRRINLSEVDAWLEKGYHRGINSTYSKLGGKKNPHSEKTKMKMSKSSKGRNNSQYGKCWIYSENDKISKSIKKVDLEIWLTRGWKRGRKLNF